MSYCRWSSDNCLCELYCYADMYGGYTTHVATNKVVGPIPQVPFLGDWPKEKIEEWMALHKAQMDFLKTAERKRIGLPCDGQSFNDPDLESFKARLLELRGMGYKFPDYVLAVVEEEIREEREKGDEEIERRSEDGV